MPTIELLQTGFTFVSDQARLGLSTVALIRGHRNILVDTGHQGRRQLLQAALAARGLGPSDIHMVVLTHSHWDHSQNVDLFPRATFCIHHNELDYARNPKPGDFATASYFPAIMRLYNVQEVVEGQELDPGVRVIETPGHTKGHISLLVDTPQGPVCIGGDAMSDATSAFRGLPGLVFWSEEQARSSIQKMLAASRTFYPGHDRPFRLEANQRVTYLAGDTSVRFTASLGYGQGTVSVTIGPEPLPQPLIL
ncbi:MAG: MBL fold metallo-hydrolase [Chloroflexi bacterium]|nr:MBL fold metallo-hydrolase [Chloroflexota bacterium]